MMIKLHDEQTIQTISIFFHYTIAALPHYRFIALSLYRIIALPQT